MAIKKSLSGSQHRKPEKPKLKSLEGFNPKLLKDGLPVDAYAIRPDENDPGTWQLPHHTKDIGRKAIEQTVDFILLERCSTSLSHYGFNGVRVIADPELIIQASRHLAGHWRVAGRQIPVILCALM